MKGRDDIASIIDFYESPQESPRDSTYSRIFQNIRSGSSNLNKLTRSKTTTNAKSTHSKSFKYNTWEITGEHEGLFEKKQPSTGLSYFSSRNVKIQEEPVVVPAEKPNMFREAIKRNSDIITNVNKQGEEMKFKRFEQYISMEVRGVKKIYDIFEIFNNGKTVNLDKPTQTVFQKMTSLFTSKKNN